MKISNLSRFILQGLEDYRSGIDHTSYAHLALVLMLGYGSSLLIPVDYILLLTIYGLQVTHIPITSILRAGLIDAIIYAITWLVCDGITIWLYPLRYCFLLFYPVLSHKGRSYGDSWAYILQRCLYFYAFGLPVTLATIYAPYLVLPSLWLMWITPACYPETKSDQQVDDFDDLAQLRCCMKWDRSPQCNIKRKRMFIPKGGKRPAYAYGIPYCPVINPIDIEDIIERTVDLGLRRIKVWLS